MDPEEVLKRLPTAAGMGVGGKRGEGKWEGGQAWVR